MSMSRRAASTYARGAAVRANRAKAAAKRKQIPLPPLTFPPPPAIVRTDAGLWGYERALRRVGFTHVAGADEAGRGACAGPLVVAAVVLPEGRRGEIPGLADSKLLTPEQREAAYAQVVARATAWSVCVIPTREVDRRGVHVANVAGMRRAVSTLAVAPSYTLTDGFPIAGMPSASCAVWKGDRVIGCIAAASVVAKVTRDRMMRELDEHFPQYAFASHKGYCTPEHDEALDTHGPCVEHRFSFVNVRRAAARLGVPTGFPRIGQDVDMLALEAAELEDDVPGVDETYPVDDAASLEGVA